MYVCICVCTHSYTNINTGTQTRKAMITLSLCVVIYMHQQQAKWAPGRSWPRVRWRLPCGRNPFKNHRFWAPRRPGVAPLRDPVPKILHFFWKGFRTRACTDLQCSLAQKCFFCNVKKVRSKGLIGYAAWGLPQGPAFACTLTISNKTKKQKLKKRKFCLGFLYQINISAHAVKTQNASLI